MKKLLSLMVILLLSLGLSMSSFAAAESVNGFTPHMKGGFLNGSYIEQSVQQVGDSAVKVTGKGGLDWPDTGNIPEPSAVGVKSVQKYDLNGLKWQFAIDSPMEYADDRWIVVSFADQPRLFNNWDGQDPVKAGFILFFYNQESHTLQIMPHTHAVPGDWTFIGNAEIPYNIGDELKFEFTKADTGYELSLDGQKLVFNHNEQEITTINWDTFLTNDEAYIVTGANIGNPDSTLYTGEFAYTIGSLAAAVVEQPEENATNHSDDAGSEEPTKPSPNPTESSNKEDNSSSGSSSWMMYVGAAIVLLLVVAAFLVRKKRA
ncbi:hypothetical protein [Paenibacillus paeoniae]|uniref:LPXTG cell wall anchor domain-containing protein n=1 Tax=Paenibacillus paeoniae TaxID=2292705 RepID=A0A371PGQ7_9BACL|nr:hypothetical protein [Paenibacillus paeoniae]REK75129.1 hypothetical protein DX130_15975 [Paenibacillus paeoniae]